MKLNIKNREILVDDDFNIDLSEYWTFINKQGYVRMQNKKSKIHTNLHRLLMGLPTGDKRVIDHINGNPLDNRKENLRICTVHQNNMHKINTPNGKYRNIYQNNFGWWTVQVQFKRKRYGGGRGFKNRDDAIALAAEVRKKLYGEYA